MKGYTENSTVILGDAEKIFDITNDIRRWPQLFTEYKEAEVVEERSGYVKFTLTMFPNKEGKVKSWTSERNIDRENMKAKARRLAPLFPFAQMDIIWTYERLPQNVGVQMTWRQEFTLDEKCPYQPFDMESYLNKATRKQMKAVRENVENLLKPGK